LESGEKMATHNYDLFHYVVCVEDWTLDNPKTKQQLLEQFETVLKGDWKISADTILLEKEEDILAIRIILGEDFVRHACLDDPEGLS